LNEKCKTSKERLSTITNITPNLAAAAKNFLTSKAVLLHLLFQLKNVGLAKRHYQQLPAALLTEFQQIKMLDYKMVVPIS